MHLMPHVIWPNANYFVSFSCQLFYFLKLGIRSNDRLIRGDQSYCPLAGALFCMDLCTKIDTRENRTWNLKRSKLQDPKPTTRPTPNGLSNSFLKSKNYECAIVTDRLLASVLKMHRSNKISSYPRGLC